MGTVLLIRFNDTLFDTFKLAYCQIKIFLFWQGAPTIFYDLVKT